MQRRKLAQSRPLCLGQIVKKATSRLNSHREFCHAKAIQATDLKVIQQGLAGGVEVEGPVLDLSDGQVSQRRTVASPSS